MFMDVFKESPHLIILGLLILGLLIYFIWRFLFPSWRLGRDLNQAIKWLKELGQEGRRVDLDDIGREAMTSTKLAHIWKEYSETLHGQSAPDEFGQERVVKWRSTVPAEVFFNVEALIAVELRTEYFKHQPGIFTGIGIIGTFVGLLRGLSDFSVSSDPEIVRKSLDVLVHGVYEAFMVSATAIALAMLTTFIEKTSVTQRIRQVEELCQLLDGQFESGAGEEYLARLVKAGESSATQTAQLKDALVSDLKQMLADLTHQQTEAIASSFRESSRAQIETTEQSGDRIAQAISDSLSDPLQKIAAAVNTTTDTNGEVVTRALNEALVTFSQKMEDMFGGQMGNMNQLLQQTTASMQATVARFDQLANNLGDAGKHAADAMGERLSAALEAMEARQQALNSTMADFVSQLRDRVRSSQAETHASMQEAMQKVGEKIAQMTEQLERQARLNTESHHEQQARLAENASQVASQLADQVQSSQAAMQEQLKTMVSVVREQTAQAQTATAEQQRRFVDDSQRSLGEMATHVEQGVSAMQSSVTNLIETLSRQSAQASQSHQETQNQLAEHASRLIETLGQQVQALTAQVNGAVAAMQSSVAALREVTTDSSRRLEGSAQTLGLAADNFAKAGNSVNAVMQQTGQVSDKMVSTALSLNQASSTVEQALANYNEAGQAMIQMVEALKNTVEAARQDAAVSQNLVEQIRQAADHLKTANTEVNGVFEKVCEELANAHEAFAKNVENSLKRGNTAYQKELKDAVDYLKTAIEELGEVAEKIPGRR